MIEAKLEGKQVVRSPAPRDAKVIDLAEALKKSVAAAKKGGRKPARAASRAPARSQRRKAG
jgi:non-homologous end joining protein Ku